MPPLARRVDLEGCADGEAAADAASGAAHGAFGRCGEGAQNECPGYRDAPAEAVGICLDAMFAEGPGQPYSEHGHYLNMTSREYGAVACGFAVAADGSLWVVQNFTAR